MSTPDSAENPVGTDLIFEDDRVRVWQIVLEPGQEAPFHTHHLDYTTVVIESSKLERINADGTVDPSEPQVGRVMRWHQGTRQHGLRNVGTTRFRNVIIEIKSLPAEFAESGRGRKEG